MTKTAFSFVMRSVALAALFTISIVSTQAAPYRFHQPQAGNWARPMQRSWAPNYGTYPSPAARVAPSVEMTNATDYMPSVTRQGTYHWEANRFPLKVCINPGEGIPSYRPQFGSFIRKGFDEWCRLSNNKLAWVEVSDSSKADIIVNWTNQVTERPEGTEAGKTDALTRLNTATGQGIIYGARMQFLTRMPDREFSDLEVAKTCMHEVGHAFGLQGHSPHSDDIMYYAVRANQEPQLSQRDINTMARLYSSYPAVDAVALTGKPKKDVELAN